MAECCTPCEPRPLHMSLEEWRIQMCMDPYYFWQWQGDQCRYCGPCKKAIVEQSWQDGDMAREDTRNAIAEAEEMLRDYLCYPVVPTIVTEEIQLNHQDYGCYYRGKEKFRVKYNHVQWVGEQVDTLLGTADVTIVVPPNGACPDTFMVDYQLTPAQIASGVTADEIVVKVSDALNTPPWQTSEPDNEIRPVHVTIDGAGLVSIRGGAWLMGDRLKRATGAEPGVPFSFYNDCTFDPLWFGGEYPNPGDPFFESNYLPTVDVYRRTVDPCAGGKVVYDRDYCSCGARTCGDADNTPTDDHCGYCEDAVFCLQKGETGIIRPAPELCSSATCRCDRATRYCVTYAAWDCTRDWRPTIAKLAAALLCERCQCGNKIITDLQTDLAHLDVMETGRRISFQEQDAIWGTLRGQVEAWKFAKRFKRMKVARI